MVASGAAQKIPSEYKKTPAFKALGVDPNPPGVLGVPTGLRVRMNEGWVLLIFPRSGLGMRYRLQLNNTVGVIDSDYYFAKNEGHIFVPLTNDSKEGKTCVIRAGEGFAQGVFVPFGVTEDDAATEVRVGGFGSTTK